VGQARGAINLLGKMWNIREKTEEVIDTMSNLLNRLS